MVSARSTGARASAGNFGRGGMKSRRWNGAPPSRFSLGSASYSVARLSPALREAMLLAWRRSFLPAPTGLLTVQLQDRRRLCCDLNDHTQRRMSLDAFEPAETATV